MAKPKAFLLRLDPAVLAGIERWAADELRSVNGQIEYLLRRSLADARRAVLAAEPPPRVNAQPADDFVD